MSENLSNHPEEEPTYTAKDKRRIAKAAVLGLVLLATIVKGGESSIHDRKDVTPHDSSASEQTTEISPDTELDETQFDVTQENGTTSTVHIKDSQKDEHLNWLQRHDDDPVTGIGMSLAALGGIVGTAYAANAALERKRKKREENDHKDSDSEEE